MMNRKILALLWSAMFLSGCTKYTDDQFFTAIKNGDTKVVQSILDQRDMTKVRDNRALVWNENTSEAEYVIRTSNEKKDMQGFSGLWVAAENGKPEMVDILLQQKFSLTEEHLGMSVVEMAAGSKPCTPKIIRSFAENGADLNAIGRLSGQPPILTAAMMKNWNCVYELIELGANTKAVDMGGRGIVTSFVEFGDNTITENLIDKLIEFDPLSSDANQALILAAYLGNSTMVKNLLNLGVDGCFIYQGKYPRDQAMKKQHTETAELLPTKEQCEKIK